MTFIAIAGWPIARTNERDEGHHLFDADERVVLVRFTEYQLDGRRHGDPGRGSEHGSVFADKVLASGVVLIVTDFHDRLVRQSINL